MIEFILILCIFALYIELSALTDYISISKNLEIFHMPKFLERTIVIMVFSYLNHTHSIHQIILMITFSLFLSAAFWLTFDMRLNQRRGLPWNYIGRTDTAVEDGKIEHFFLKYFKDPDKISGIMKILGVLITASTYILIRFNI